jgi:hypothetical protein
VTDGAGSVTCVSCTHNSDMQAGQPRPCVTHSYTPFTCGLLAHALFQSPPPTHPPTQVRSSQRCVSTLAVCS